MTCKNFQNAHQNAHMKAKNECKTNPCTTSLLQQQLPLKDHFISKVTKPLRDPDKIVIVARTANYANSIQIKKDFAKLFPLRKLVYAFNTARGNIHSEFLKAEKAEEVYHNWKPECLGQASQARKINSIEAPNKVVLINGVPTDIEETEIERMLSSNYARLKAIRFVKKGAVPSLLSS